MLCWKPGQRTPIHDHNGSYGAVRVCEGVMWETSFMLDDDRRLYYHSAREWAPGETTAADVPDIHQIGNPDISGRDLVTLHLYAPPLGVINTYKVRERESSYSPNEFMDARDMISRARARRRRVSTLVSFVLIASSAG